MTKEFIKKMCRGYSDKIANIYMKGADYAEVVLVGKYNLMTVLTFVKTEDKITITKQYATKGGVWGTEIINDI